MSTPDPRDDDLGRLAALHSLRQSGGYKGTTLVLSLLVLTIVIGMAVLVAVRGDDDPVAKGLHYRAPVVDRIPHLALYGARCLSRAASAQDDPDDFAGQLFGSRWRCQCCSRPVQQARCVWIIGEKPCANLSVHRSGDARSRLRHRRKHAPSPGQRALMNIHMVPNSRVNQRI